MLSRTTFLLAISMLSTSVGAHHSPAALFNLSERISVTGTVVEYRIVNPHVIFVLDVVGRDGSPERWVAEGGAPSVLRRSGWTGQELQPGDRITIVGNPSQDGSRIVNLQVMTLSDGGQFVGANGIAPLASALQARWERHTAAIRRD